MTSHVECKAHKAHAVTLYMRTDKSLAPSYAKLVGGVSAMPTVKISGLEVGRTGGECKVRSRKRAPAPGYLGSDGGLE